MSRVVPRYLVAGMVAMASTAGLVLPFSPALAAGTGSVSLTALDVPYTQTFDTLATTGTTNTTLPTGWYLAESGTSSRNNDAYGASTGSDNAGDVYSFGAGGISERAFGTLRSGTLIPTTGVSFTNNSGSTVSTLAISYVGEQWRLGTSGRGPDRLDFQYSLDATSLTTGSWTDADGLDCSSPVTDGTVGALDGNTAGNRTAIQATIQNLAVADGATFWIRWTDFDASGADDGLGADEFSLTPSGAGGNLSGTGSADPSSVQPGETTTLSVTVTPATEPDSTGITVTGDLSSIGGSAAQVFADADADLTFTFAATVAGGTAPGTTTLPIDIADAEGREAETTISLTVQPEPVQIWEIQGAAHISPMNGDQVFGVDGIVTAVSPQGFWMTDPEPDGDDATSDGIFVFRGASGTKPAVGDHVDVDGTVSEFRPGGAGGNNLTITQIGSATFSVMTSGNALPVTLVGEGGRTPPTESIDNDSTGSVEDRTIVDPEKNGIDFWESLEGMYLQVNDAVAVGPRNGFGEIAVVADGGADAGPFTSRGGLYVAPGDFNPERLILDDVITPTPFVNTGDAFTTAVTGVLDYGFGNFKLYPTTALVGVSGGIEREVTDAPGAREIAVASFNVENLSVVNAQAKFDELAGQIVHNLRSPDLLAIQEIQDDSGPQNNGVVTAAATWQRLLDTIVAVGGPAYEYRSIDPVNNADGGAPGANIRVGFIFRTDRDLEFVDRPGGTSVNDTAVVESPAGPRLTFSPGRIGTADDAFLETRKSLVGEFRWRGEKLFVVGNHFSSKNGDDPLFGRFQPPVRYTEFYFPGGAVADTDGWRWGQAQVVNDFADDVLALDPDANVIVLGDINDFHFSDTVRILKGTAIDVRERTVESTGEPPVLTTLFDLLPANEQYSYIFDGNSQVLDQILVSGNVLDRDPRYDVVHVNAEFAVQASDHEPSVMRVAFQPRRGG
jgi:hypothetical protein